MTRLDDRYLVISDLQIPFEAQHALPFVKAVKREFRIPDENMLCAGDELDQLFGGRWPKNPDIPLSAVAEIKAGREGLKPWYRAFPKMRVAVSNHMLRWIRKASEAGIPSELLRSYREVIDAPAGWRWQDEWIIKAGREPFKMIHGMGYGGMYAYRHAAMDQGMNICFGHLHANAGIAHIVTATKRCWGLNVGSLIDPEAYAFEYGKYNRFKPWLGIGVVLDGGLTPVLVPYERFRP